MKYIFPTFQTHNRDACLHEKFMFLLLDVIFVTNNLLKPQFLYFKFLVIRYTMLANRWENTNRVFGTLPWTNNY